MIDNRPILAELFAHRRIALSRGALLDEHPPAITTSPEALRDRVEGMLLGLAIGDSLGNACEGTPPAARAERYGEIRDYLPHRAAEGRAVGLPSDDTQLAFWMLEQLLEDGGLVPDHLARRYCEGRIYGIGQTVRGFIRAYRDEGRPWWEAGPASAGNGALMRIAPILVPHLRAPSPALWADVAIAAMLTHNDRASTASCVAFVRMLWMLLDMREPPAPEWWVNSFVEAARQLEGETTSYESRSPALTYRGPLWRFVDTEVRAALAAGWSVREACERWYSAAYLLETVPAVLFTLARHGSDAEEAIVRAVNDTWDNDTVGAIVGAAVGALHGRAALPGRWIDGLLGRTCEADDGRVFELTRLPSEQVG